MKRWLLTGAAVLAGAGTCAPAVIAAAPPTTQLVNPGCHRALLPDARRIAITAVMRPVNGTMTLAMMFDLQRSRRRAGPFAIVHGRGLERWIHPDDPTLGQRPGDVWKVDQKVTNLPATFYYRFRVRFRWTGANGRTLGTVSDAGPLCFQPELRPDLLVKSVTVKPVTGQPSEDRYVAVIANRGRTRAGAFEVELIVPSNPPQSTTVAGVRPHDTARATLTAPACAAGSQLTVIADPSGAIPDHDRANNTLTAQCPSATQARRYP